MPGSVPAPASRAYGQKDRNRDTELDQRTEANHPMPNATGVGHNTAGAP
jgi:hypothetical protein